MYSFRRILNRTARGTKSRVQVVILIIVVILLGYYVSSYREEKHHPSEIIETNTIPVKKIFPFRSIVTDGPPAPAPAPAEAATDDSSNCAYKNCPKLRDDVINVHIICHTHLDPGWLNSVDGYFFGIQHGNQMTNNGQPYRHTMPSVLTIFNNVMGAILENSRRRFVMVEMSFIWRWWKRLDEDFKDIVRKLMNDGRLDIAGGSWTSNDEAVSHYSAMIDQSTLGLRFLKTQLRTCPQPAVAWQLDLFGHGREINSLFAQMGYDAILFGRLDYQEKNERTNSKTLQMIWNVNENAPENERWLFTGILPNLYHPPETLALKSDVVGSLLRPSDTDTIRESASVYSRRLLDELVRQQERYNSNNIAVIYGGDFEYEDATQYFQNIDAMIDTINNLQNQTENKKKFFVHYSTPTCFLHALSKEKRSWPQRHGDFMSYAHRAHAFWTGFYTSRPGIKFYERSLSALYQSLRQLSISTSQIDFSTLFELSEIMGLLQHHDTITGTSPLVNIEDILLRMSRIERSAHNLATSLFHKLLSTEQTTNLSSSLIFCRLNESHCQPLINLNEFSSIIYNPSSRPTTVWLRIPVGEEQTIVLHSDIVKKNSIDVQQIGIFPISDPVLKIPIGQKRDQLHELIVRVHLPPLTLQAIPFIATKQKQNLEPSFVSVSSCSIENQFFILKTNEKGLITSLKMKSTGKEIDFQQTFGHYRSSGPDQLSHQSSGLYVFRPIGFDPPTTIGISQFHCVKRQGYEEIIQIYSKYVNQSIRLLDGSTSIEFDWIVGNLDPNVEFVTSYQSKQIQNDGTFYTDSSGRSLMKRKRDKRDGYTFTQSIKTAGNYFPLVTGILLKDEKQDLQLSVVTDRAEGGGSLQDGAVEIMIHRRVMTDDGLGVSETLNEVGIDNQPLKIRGRHLVSVAKIDDGIEFFREHALKSVWKPIISFRNDQNNPKLNYKSWSMLKSELPPQLNILTLEPVIEEKSSLTILLRLENIYEPSEHSKLSKTITVDIQTIFKDHNIVEVTEMTLGANMEKRNAFTRLKWNLDSPPSNNNEVPPTKPTNSKTIELRPMEIRSFHVKLTK